MMGIFIERFHDRYSLEAPGFPNGNACLFAIEVDLRGAPLKSEI